MLKLYHQIYRVKIGELIEPKNILPPFPIFYHILISMMDVFNFTVKAKQVAGGKYEEGTGPIYFTNFMCEGDEDTLLECPHEEVVAINKKCNHSKEAGAICMARE